MNELSDRERLLSEDARPTSAVISDVLTKDVDSDGDDYWNLIGILQARLPSIFDAVKQLGTSDDANARDVAATVLGQNGRERKVWADECVSLLLSMLLSEKVAKVQASIIFALGHHHHTASLPILLKFETHPDVEVRYALTHSIGGLDEDTALEALCRLSADADRDVRSWATFGIGTLSHRRTTSIRDALTARLLDQDDEVRGEALVGLAERCEVCVAPALLSELEKHSLASLRDWSLIQDASAAIERCNKESPQPSWSNLLARLKALGISGR